MALLDIVRKHGSIGNIPQDVLEQYGYVRIETEGSVRLRRKKDVLLELNNQYSFPEERFSFEGHGGNVDTSHLPEAQQQIIDKAIRASNELLGGDELFVKTLGEEPTSLIRLDDSARIFQRAVEEVYKEKWEEDERLWSKENMDKESTDLSSAINRICITSETPHTSLDDMIDGVGTLREIMTRIDDTTGENEYISQQSLNLEAALLEAQRARSILQDTDRHRQTWNRSRKSVGYKEDDFLDKPSIIVQNVFGKTATAADIYKTFIGEVFEYTGLKQLADHVRDQDTLEDITQVLLDADVTNPPAKQQRIQLQQAIRDAPIEKKRELSQDLKKAKETEKYQRNILLGAQTVIQPYKVVRDTLLGYIDTIVETIESTITRLDQPIALTIDPTPNAELDRDPGALTGDCTVGRPLPFSHPQLRNLKVYEGESHIGNIYCLSTQDDEGSVWLLDAIQIPKKLDWKQTISKFRQAFGEQAKKQGVKKVYVNKESEQISNHDYIGDVLEKELPLQQKHRAPDIPKELLSGSAHRSPLQTRGYHRTLWEDAK